MATTAQLAQHKKVFLQAFRLTGNVSQSAAAAGVARHTAYNWQEHDDEFAAAYRDAELHATELLEAEAHRRAVFGVPKMKPIYHNGVLLDVVEEREYSDTLLIFLLKARAPDKYRERFDVTRSDVPLIKEYQGVDLGRV